MEYDLSNCFLTCSLHRSNPDIRVSMELLRYCQCLDGNTESYLYDTYEWGNRKRCKRIPENQILIVDFV